MVPRITSIVELVEAIFGRCATVDHVDRTGPIRQHELGHATSGMDISALKRLPLMDKISMIRPKCALFPLLCLVPGT